MPNGPLVAHKMVILCEYCWAFRPRLAVIYYSSRNHFQRASYEQIGSSYVCKILICIRETSPSLLFLEFA